MADTLADPVTQARQLIAEARQAFATDVDQILTGLSGELRHAILERFDLYLPMRRLADVVLLQLVREMYDYHENPESTVNLEDWVRVAAPIVGAEILGGKEGT
jgi:hypothetical protein